MCARSFFDCRREFRALSKERSSAVLYFAKRSREGQVFDPGDAAQQPLRDAQLFQVQAFGFVGGNFWLVMAESEPAESRLRAQLPALH
jgi:hypothetical protein